MWPVIPLRDSTRSRRYPWFTLALIVVNVAVFWHELQLGEQVTDFFYTYGLVPRRLWQPGLSLTERLQPLFTSMFIHVGWVHIASNMLYLWIFGDNVEDRLGRGRYLLFYLATGLAAALTQVAVTTNPDLPIIGASGAISGVLGAYLRLFPWSRVLALVPVFFFLQVVEIPAVLFLVVWFLGQLAQGTLALATLPGGGGPAWWAHIGGFVAGWILAGPYVRRTPRWI